MGLAAEATLLAIIHTFDSLHVRSSELSTRRSCACNFDHPSAADLCTCSIGDEGLQSVNALTALTLEMVDMGWGCGVHSAQPASCGYSTRQVMPRPQACRSC
jgi:hypothetical protein